uniref:lipopolysaccharide heptosyltransferase II n=1 Tax=Ralstonia solanacearum TaxID=305 RepID=O33490_RALSL|nr:rfaF [Ralstonia solanacearum K60]
MMRKILVVAPNWIGDALMGQPLFAQIKRAIPRAQIHAIAPKWVAPVVARMPEIARVLPTELAHGKLQLGSRTLFAQQLKGESFDAAYVLPNSFKSALIPWLAGIPVRIGYKGESRLGVLNVRYPNPPKRERPPMVQHYARCLQARPKLPETLSDPHLQVDLQRVAATSAKFGIPGNARLIAFCPGAEYGPAKRWPAEHFAELAQMLRRSFPYAHIVTLGSAKDRETADATICPTVRSRRGHPRRLPRSAAAPRCRQRTQALAGRGLRQLHPARRPRASHALRAVSAAGLDALVEKQPVWIECLTSRSTPRSACRSSKRPSLRFSEDATEASLYVHTTYVLMQNHEGWRIASTPARRPKSAWRSIAHSLH